jgi:hypothetical protein
MTRRRAERPPWCGHCDPDSRLVQRPDGLAARCMGCHAATQPGGRHAPRVPGSGTRHLDLMVTDR